MRELVLIDINGNPELSGEENIYNMKSENPDIITISDSHIKERNSHRKVHLRAINNCNRSGYSCE